MRGEDNGNAIHALARAAEVEARGFREQIVARAAVRAAHIDIADAARAAGDAHCEAVGGVVDGCPSAEEVRHALNIAARHHSVEVVRQCESYRRAGLPVRRHGEDGQISVFRHRVFCRVQSRGYVCVRPQCDGDIGLERRSDISARARERHYLRQVCRRYLRVRRINAHWQERRIGAECHTGGDGECRSKRVGGDDAPVFFGDDELQCDGQMRRQGVGIRDRQFVVDGYGIRPRTTAGVAEVLLADANPKRVVCEFRREEAVKAVVKPVVTGHAPLHNRERRMRAGDKQSPQCRARAKGEFRVGVERAEITKARRGRQTGDGVGDDCELRRRRNLRVTQYNVQSARRLAC